MDYEKLAAHREVLLDLYNSLNETLEKEGHEVPRFIEQSQENIRAEKFLLAIVGEVKAGKSTFINALLGKEILPFDALQATSEIIEIVKSDKQEVRVTFADGTEQVVEDDLQTPENEAVNFLKRIASVQDEYRDIPIIQVNKFLMDHYKKKDKKAVFDKKVLKAFLSHSQLENVHKLDEETFKEKICKYINKNISCDNIPKSITLGYPHDLFDFRHFRIVDTPGINAKGGLENQTKEFLDQADAVIYLHKAPPIESKSLANALENELPEKVKEHLMIVLTHKSNSTDEESEELLAETKRYYPEIGSDNIFFVDSLTELRLRDFNKKEMSEIQTILFEDTGMMQLTAAIFMRANNDKHQFLNLLEEQANFREIRKRIEKDAQNSASIQMKRFASAIQEEYEAIDNRISAYIEPLRTEYKDPQTFASAMKEINKEIEKMRSDYNEFTKKLREDFSSRDMNSKYYKLRDQMTKNVIDKINKKKFAPNNHTAKDVWSYMEKLHKDFENDRISFLRKLETDFKKIIETKNKEAQSTYSITIPKIALQSILREASDAANRSIANQLARVERSFWDDVVHFFSDRDSKSTEDKRDKIRRYLPIDYWSRIKSDLPSHYLDADKELQEKIETMINNFCSKYENKFDRELTERQQYIKKFEQSQKKNEGFGDKISHLEKKKEIINTNIQKCVNIGGQL